MLKLSHLNGTPVLHHVALMELTNFCARPTAKTLMFERRAMPDNALPSSLDTSIGRGRTARADWPVVAKGVSKTFEFIIAKPPTRKRKQFRARQGEWYALVNLGDPDCPVWVGVALAHVVTDEERDDCDMPGWIAGCREWPQDWVAAVRDLVCGSEAK